MAERLVVLPPATKGRWPVSRFAEYCVKAGEHVKLAQSGTEEVRKIHATIAESFLALAGNEEWLEDHRALNVREGSSLIH